MTRDARARAVDFIIERFHCGFEGELQHLQLLHETVAEGAPCGCATSLGVAP